VASTVSSDLFSRIPLIGTPTAIITSAPTKHSFLQQHFPAIFAATATTLGLIGYYAFATGFLVWPHGQELMIFGRKRLADYGHLGAALAGMSLVGRQATRGDGLVVQESLNAPIGVEVEVEKDGMP
jgi:sorting and assembly machinery component 37